MRASWLRRAFVAGVFAGSCAVTGCAAPYRTLRASPPATWRGAAVFTVQPVDWSAARIDGMPHAAFAAQLGSERQPLLYTARA